LDLDKNKKMESAEKGMKDIVLSDGYEVVKTAEDGSFNLKKNDRVPSIDWK